MTTARRHPASYQKLPAKTATAWMWLDMLLKVAKLPPLALVFVVALAAIAVMVVIAWWPILLAVVVCYIALRWYRKHRRLNRARGGPTRGGSIPYGGRLSLIEWLACRMIEACEGLLRQHNRRRL